MSCGDLIVLLLRILPHSMLK